MQPPIVGIMTLSSIQVVESPETPPRLRPERSLPMVVCAVIWEVLSGRLNVKPFQDAKYVIANMGRCA